MGGELELGVDVGVDKTTKIIAETTTGIVTGVVAAIIITLIVLAIVGALVAMAIRRKRGEEADRKADVKKGADKAEADISFRMDEMENARDNDALVEQIKGLKGENDRLREMQDSSKNKRTRRNKKKADGFGQQQE